MHPADLAYAYIDWADADDVAGNTFHIAPTGITPGELEAVIRDAALPILTSASSGRPMKIGYDAAGDKIAVVWEVTSVRPLVVYPKTAYHTRKP